MSPGLRVEPPGTESEMGSACRGPWASCMRLHVWLRLRAGGRSALASQCMRQSPAWLSLGTSYGVRRWPALGAGGPPLPEVGPPLPAAPTSRRGGRESHFRGRGFSVGSSVLRQRKAGCLRRHVAIHQSPHWERRRRPGSEDPWWVGRAEGLCWFPRAWAHARPPWLRLAARCWTCRSTWGRPMSLIASVDSSGVLE